MLKGIQLKPKSPCLLPRHNQVNDSLYKSSKNSSACIPYVSLKVMLKAVMNTDLYTFKNWALKPTPFFIHCCITNARWYLDNIWGDAVWQYLLWWSEFMLQRFYDLQKMPNFHLTKNIMFIPNAMLKYSNLLWFISTWECNLEFKECMFSVAKWGMIAGEIM